MSFVLYHRMPSAGIWICVAIFAFFCLLLLAFHTGFANVCLKYYGESRQSTVVAVNKHIFKLIMNATQLSTLSKT